MAIPDNQANEQTILQQADAFREAYKNVRTQIAKMVVGHDQIIDGVLTCLFTGGNALLEGVPGLDTAGIADHEGHAQRLLEH